MKSRAAEFLCYDIVVARGYRAGVMRIFLRATACMMLFAGAPAIAQNCAAIQAACTAQCRASRSDASAGLHQPMFNCALPTNAAYGSSL